MTALDELRGRLDGIDRRLVQTLAERLVAVAEIARVKAVGLPFLRDHEREARLLKHVEGLARELGIDPFRTQEIFREVIAMSLKAQEEALLARERSERASSAAHRVVYQGTPGSYSHIAARKYFADRASAMEMVGLTTFEAALHSAERGEAGWAFLPIENTTAGSINQVHELLLGTEPDPRIPSKTSLVLVTPHRHGALAHCLAVLAEHGLNLTKLESRPVPRRPWEYLFYIDFEGSLASEPATSAVAVLRRECPYLKVLGSYPARTTPAGAVDRAHADATPPSGSEPRVPQWPAKRGRTASQAERDVRLAT
jgi:chorismate mutase